MAIGKIQVSKRKEKISHCKKIYSLYEEAIKDFDFIKIIDVNIKYEVPIYIEVISKKRKRLVKFLSEKGININLLPPSLHLSKHIKQDKNVFPNSLYYNKHSFILPSGPNQSISNVNYVIGILKEYNEKV